MVPRNVTNNFNISNLSVQNTMNISSSFNNTLRYKLLINSNMISQDPLLQNKLFYKHIYKKI
jgi:hypothetical protein